MHLHYRTRKYGKNVYKNYAVARSYRDDGKVKKSIFMELGKLTDRQAMKIRQILRETKDLKTIYEKIKRVVPKKVKLSH